MKPFLFISLFLFIQIQAITGEGSILDDYEKCKTEKSFGISGAVLCDPDNSLKPGTATQLHKLLDQLKEKITCNCENGCSRGNDVSSDFVGLLIVSTTDKIDKAERPLAASAQEIYEDALLGNSTCDNGLLIVYVQDKQKLATYRGGGNFLLFTDKDMERLHQISVKGSSTIQDEAALRYLLTNYDALVERNAVDRADPWTPLWGLGIAALLLLVLLALLAACLIARFCCCCRDKTHKKDSYYVTPVSTYKPTPEPIYIVTPPPPPMSPGRYSDPRQHQQHESIYSTAFTPPPPGHHPSTFTPRSQHSISGASRPVTPASTSRTRVAPQSSSASTKQQTPVSVSRNVSTSSKQKNKVAPAPPPTESPLVLRPTSTESPQQIRPTSTDVPSDGSIDLPFLDPQRPRETQSKQDFIY